MNLPKKKLNILISQRFAFGGGVISAHYFCRHLAKLGHQVTCVYIKNILAKNRPVFLEPDGYNIAWIGAYLPLCHLTFKKFLKNYFKKNKVDVLITLSSEGVSIEKICNQYSVLSIASYHGSPFFAGMDTSFRKHLFRGPGGWLFLWDLFLKKKKLKEAKIVHCLSEYQKKATVENLKIPAEKISVVYLGADIQKFSCIKNKEEKPFHILYCGGFVFSKGINILLKAFSLVTENYENVFLDILGGGNQEPYKKMIADFGIDDKIKYYGHIPYNKIEAFYQRAFIFVSPTKAESFGLGITDAMASALPVVASNVASVPEIVGDRKTGFLVPYNNPEAFAEEIIYLLNNPEKARLMGMAGRKRVEENFTWEKTALNLENLIYRHLPVQKI